MAFNLKKWSKRYYIKHKEEIKKKCKRYYQNHIESFKEKNRERYQKRKERIKEDKKAHPEKYGRKALRENKPWLLCYDNIRGRCYYKKHPSYPSYGAKDIKCCITGKELKRLWFRDEAYNMKHPSIHRKDHNKDYTFGNCQFIEWVKNRGRHKEK